MQQTEKYQFNLIEGSDPFSPEPLNQNMEKVEGALTARARVLTGSYTGAGQYGADHPNVLEFPDAERPPSVIFVNEANGSASAVLVRGAAYSICYWDTYNRYVIRLTWTDKGVRWYSADSSNRQFNSGSTAYSYVAII